MADREVNFACKCGLCISQHQDPYKLRYPDCPSCGEIMRYVKRPPENDRRPTGCFDVPIVMYSVGLHPSEYVAFKKANREIDLNDQGVPIARTRQQKKQILKYFDYEEKN